MVSALIFIVEQHLKHTNKLLLTSLSTYWITISYKKAKQNNYTTRKLINSWQTDTSLVSVHIAIIRVLMATNAKAADVTFHPQSSSIQRVLSAVRLLFYAKLRTGIYLLTTIKHGLKSGFWKDIRNGEPMFMVNVKAG